MQAHEVRFIYEVKELKERISKLQNILVKWSQNRLDFTPKCSKALLSAQYSAMQTYYQILLERAEIEGFEL